LLLLETNKRKKGLYRRRMYRPTVSHYQIRLHTYVFTYFSNLNTQSTVTHIDETLLCNNVTFDILATTCDTSTNTHFNFNTLSSQSTVTRYTAALQYAITLHHW